MAKTRMRLRTWRADRSVTQAQLVMRIAKLLPAGRTMGQSRYSQIENGEANPPDDIEKTAVASALDVRVSDIDWPDVAQRVSA